MKNFRTINDINTDVDEGKVLIQTLAMLSGEGKFTKMTSDEILQKMTTLAKEIFYDKTAVN